MTARIRFWISMVALIVSLASLKLTLWGNAQRNLLVEENAHLNRVIAACREQIALLEEEQVPPHMVTTYTGADGKKWIHDPWKPWLKDVPEEEWRARLGIGTFAEIQPGRDERP